MGVMAEMLCLFLEGWMLKQIIDAKCYLLLITYYLLIILRIYYWCSMGVTAEMLRPFLEGWTLKQIIDAKRLFLVDLKILDKIPTKNNRPVRCLLLCFLTAALLLLLLSLLLL